ncbi:MAG: class I adenylate-forming enzyme family protein [Actinomycetota bacterium]
MPGPVITDFVSLWDLVEQRASLTPDHVIATDEDHRSLTCAQYRDEVLRVAAGLHGLGVGRDTNVSWILPTWLEAFVLVGALARLEAVQNPMLPIYRDREVRFITAQTGARLIITPSEWKGFDYGAMCRAAAADLPGLEVLVCDRGAPGSVTGSLPVGDPATLPAFAPVPDAASAPVRWIFYSSGTTADPKGARHTDPSVRASADAMTGALALTDDDVFGLVFPFTHIGGQTWTFSALMSGCKLVFVEAFVPAVAIPFLRGEDITLAGAGTPFHMAYLDAQRQLPPGEALFPKVRAFPGGASAKPPQLHYDILAEMGGVGIASGYGLTEFPIATMAHVTDDPDELAYAEGRPGPDVRLKIVTLDGRIAGADEEGEIRTKGRQMFRGYVDASLDEKAWDEDGWFLTGDLGKVNAAGNIVITGRLKDVIIRKGENSSAKEVEDLLCTHPKIADVAVIGLPDPALGERCCAVVQPATPGDPPTLAEVFEFCRDAGLMTQKIPEQLEVVEAMPRNPAGKVLKNDLRQRFAPT